MPRNLPDGDYAGPSGYPQAGFMPRGNSPSVEGLEALGEIKEGRNAAIGGKTTPRKKWTPEDWEEQMRLLFERLSKGLDFNDPRTQSILMNARNTTMQSANDRGIFGGYSENAAEGSYIGAASKLQQQQDMMAMQALGMGSGYSKGLADDAYSRAMSEWNEGKDEAGGFGAGLGGVLGALGGGAVGFFTGGGIPGALAGAGGGWNFGSNVGAGLGQMGYDKPRPQYGGY